MHSLFMVALITAAVLGTAVVGRIIAEVLCATMHEDDERKEA